MDSINVAVRVRPLNRREIDGGRGQTWLIAGNSITQCAPTGACGRGAKRVSEEDARMQGDRGRG